MSSGLESYCPQLDRDLEDLPFADLGAVAIPFGAPEPVVAAVNAAPRQVLSLGLAPLVVKEIFRIIERLRAEGTSILLVEQNARAALEVADHGYVLETGSIAVDGPAAELAHNPRVIESYLGTAQSENT